MSVLIPGHCLSIYFLNNNKIHKHTKENEYNLDHLFYIGIANNVFRSKGKDPHLSSNTILKTFIY